MSVSDSRSLLSKFLLIYCHCYVIISQQMKHPTSFLRTKRVPFLTRLFVRRSIRSFFTFTTELISHSYVFTVEIGYNDV